MNEKMPKLPKIGISLIVSNEKDVGSAAAQHLSANQGHSNSMSENQHKFIEQCKPDEIIRVFLEKLKIRRQ